MAARYKRKTKNFFLKKDLQGKIILAIFISVIGGCLLFIMLLALLSSDTMTITYSQNNLEIGATPWILFKNAVAANWIFLVIGGTMLVLISIIGSHRIAGPLFRFEKSLTMMSEGNLSDTIYLREKDEGKDLAEKINCFNELLSAKLKTIDRHAEAINDLMKRYQHLDTDLISPEDATSICKAIKQHNEKLRKEISFFTLAND